MALNRILCQDLRASLERKGVGQMIFNTGSALLDAVVLSVVSQEDEGTYGYRITQEVRRVLDVSESTLYPVLRRLQKDECLSVYDQEYAGRNRRYYRITQKGLEQLVLYRRDWESYSAKITEMLKEKESSSGAEKAAETVDKQKGL